MKYHRVSVLLFAALILALAGCQPAAIPQSGPLESTPSAIANLVGAGAARLTGAAALTVQEQPGTQAFSIVPVDAATGKPVEGIEPLQTGSVFSVSFSTDRREMVFFSSQAVGCRPACLHRLDLASWQESEPVSLDGSGGNMYIVPAFDASRADLPVVMESPSGARSVIVLVNREQAAMTRKTELPASIFKAAYTSTGDLALYGVQFNPQDQASRAYVALVGGADLRLIWETTLPDVTFVSMSEEALHQDPSQGKYYDPAAVFAADGSRLYVVAADRPLLVTVDFERQKVATAKIQPPTSLLDRLMALTARPVHAKVLNGVSKQAVLSADGRHLYVVGQETRALKNERDEYEMEFSFLGLQVIEARTGTLVRSVATEANYLALDLDGKTLLLRGWRNGPGGDGHPWTDVLDTTTWQVTRRLVGTAFPSHLLDGSPAWLVSEMNAFGASSLQVYRPGQSEPQSEVHSPGYIDWIPIP